jgi:hypothetical protein
MFTKEYLHERFEYRDGELYWKQVFSRRLVVGQLAGDTDGSGYRRVMIGTNHYKMHILIWWMHRGGIPEGLLVDHKDMNKSNNRLDNLRLLSKSQNNRNRVAKGVSFDKSRNKRRAQISIDNRTVMLGRYASEDEAKTVYEAAKAKLLP